MAVVVSALLTWLIPARFLAAPTAGAPRVVGIAMIVAAPLIVFAAGRLFKRVGTLVTPTKPSTALVTDGIYRWIRNPMYLGL